MKLLACIWKTYCVDSVILLSVFVCVVDFKSIVVDVKVTSWIVYEVSQLKPQRIFLYIFHTSAWMDFILLTYALDCVSRLIRNSKL